MDNLLVVGFTDLPTEFSDFASHTPSIDITDMPLYSSRIPALSGDSKYYVASARDGGISGIDFNMANNFWGCQFRLTLSNCGTSIRQGIAHLIDKTVFANNEPLVAGYASPVDNPAGFETPTPNPCLWDTLYPQTGLPQCTVGPTNNSPGGGVAYHLATATGVNYPWQPALGSPDFCAAANHFVNASLATGRDPTTCVLTGLNSTVTCCRVPDLYIRNDNPVLTDLGNSIAQEICALFGRGFSTGCVPYLTVTPGPISSFQGFGISPTADITGWWMYTDGPGTFNALDGLSDVLDHYTELVFPPDFKLNSLKDQMWNIGTSLVWKYYSADASNPASIHPQCLSTLGSYSPSNYGGVCNPAYDAVAKAIATAPCVSATGDPSPGQVNPTFANCPGTSQLTMVSAAYQAEDTFGKGAFAIPIFVGSDHYGYLSNWSRIIDSPHGGIFNYFTWLDAYSANPPTARTIRVGFSQPPDLLSPYLAKTTWELAIVRSVYDSLSGTNPLRGDQALNWMTVTSQPVTNANLAYTPPPGTVTTYRYSLRGDLFWQNDNTGSHPAMQVTSWDVAFSYLSMVATGAFQSAGASGLTGVTILSPSAFDLNLKAVPFTPSALEALTILPGQYWVSAGQTSTGQTVSGQTLWNNAVRDTTSTCNGQGTASAKVACFRAQFTLSTSTLGTSGIPAVHCADSSISSGAFGCTNFQPSPHPDTQDLLDVDTSK